MGIGIGAVIVRPERESSGPQARSILRLGGVDYQAVAQVDTVAASHVARLVAAAFL